MDEIGPGPEGQRFAALWEQHSRRVLAYALRHVDPDTAQEVLSETFLVAWRRLADVPGAPLPWLLVVARNTIANHRRSTYRRAVVHRELAHLERVAEGAPAADVDPVERDAMLRALAALSAREREALLLTAWDGLSPAQAAQVAGCSTNAFTVRLSRSRARLRRGVDAPDADRSGVDRSVARPLRAARPPSGRPAAVVLTDPSPVEPR